jgi:hypothetical protein
MLLGAESQSKQPRLPAQSRVNKARSHLVSIYIILLFSAPDKRQEQQNKHTRKQQEKILQIRKQRKPIRVLKERDPEIRLVGEHSAGCSYYSLLFRRVFLQFITRASLIYSARRAVVKTQSRSDLLHPLAMLMLTQSRGAVSAKSMQTTRTGGQMFSK